jgi:opacity protein-like surface antigen
MKQFDIKFVHIALSLMVVLPVAVNAGDGGIKAPTGNNHWYVTGFIGSQKPDIATVRNVANGLGLPRPYAFDQYSFSSKYALLIGAEGGYLWANSRQFLPAYSLGLKYKYMFSQNIGGQITQFSLPQFTNYDYSWQLYSQSILASAKVNVFRWKRMMPYVSGGVGVALNTTNRYIELGRANVTPRISPSFGNKTLTEFTYTLGVGLDWQPSVNTLLSVGYEYQDLRKLASDYGVGSWSSASLRSRSFSSNGILFTRL